MIKAQLGDITKVAGVTHICSAANGTGPMRSGVAGAIKRAGGDAIELEAFRICRDEDPQVGEAYVTTAGELPYSGVIHLVTMKKPSGMTFAQFMLWCHYYLFDFFRMFSSPRTARVKNGTTSYDIVRTCLSTLVAYCKEHNITNVALPALGTGVGRLDRERVALIFKDELEAENIVFHVVDIDEQFISALQG